MNGLSFLSRRPFLFSLLAVGVLTALILSTFRVFFQICDDSFFLMLLKGVGFSDAPVPVNIHMNVVLTWALSSLYRSFPGVPWYVLFHLGSIILSLTAILAALQLSPYRHFKTFLFFLASGIFFYFLTVLQWTMTASLAAIGAYFLLAALWRREEQDHRKPALVLALVLILVSAALRASSFFLIVLLVLPSVLKMVWKVEWTEARKGLVRFAGLAALGVVLLLCVHKAFFLTHAGWKEAAEVEAAYFQLGEIRHPLGGPDRKTLLDAAGWTQNDLDLATHWFYLDRDTYSPEKMLFVAKGFAQFAWEKDPRYPLGYFLTYKTVWCLLLTALFLSFFLPRERVRSLVLSSAWVLAVLFCLWFGFKLPGRVFLPAIFLLMNWVLFEAEPRGWREDLGSRRSKALLSLALLAVFLAGWANLDLVFWEKGNNGEQSLWSDRLRAALTQFHPKDDQLYVSWDSAFPYEWIPAFGDYDRFRHFHQVSLSWLQRSPTTYDMLGRFGVKDLFRDLVDNPKLLLICSQKEGSLYKKHMWEKYRMEIEPKAVFDCPMFGVYSVYSVQKFKQVPAR